MATWLLPVFEWLLSNLPVGAIIKAVISVLRKLASDTSNQIDDKAVDFVELVFIEMGLISSDASDVASLATKQK